MSECFRFKFKITFFSSGVCVLPQDQGSGVEALSRYYYDQSSDTCRQFTYRGTAGNENRFSTLNSCELTSSEGKTALKGEEFYLIGVSVDKRLSIANIRFKYAIDSRQSIAYLHTFFAIVSILFTCLFINFVFLVTFFPGRDQYYWRLFFVGLLSREHPKAQPGGLFLLLFLEKPGVEPANPGLQGELEKIYGGLL